MPHVTSPFDTVMAAIDAHNAADPRRDVVDGVARPREVVYAERMSACLMRLYPDASDQLRIATCAQHIGRWEIPRDRFPLGRDGYNAWRTACRSHHVALITPLMQQAGYPDADIAQVAKMIRKQELKQDPGSQALENVAAFVFVAYYLADFAAAHLDHGDDKLVSILRKTMRKMDHHGQAAVRTLRLPPLTQRLVDLASD